MTVSRIFASGWNRIWVFESVGATGVVPVASVDTSLLVMRVMFHMFMVHDKIFVCQILTIFFIILGIYEFLRKHMSF